MQIIRNVFPQNLVDFIREDIKKYSWSLQGKSAIEQGPAFWYRDLENSECKNIFKEKIAYHLKKDIKIDRIYMNGQAHGQCGFWHLDARGLNKFSFIYFIHEWKPEYAGHFMIKINNEVHSVLPEFNKGILFDSNLQHMALSPSRYCLTQRESIAIKFSLL